MKPRKEDIINSIIDLETIRTTLARIGSQNEESVEELSLAICYFVLKFNIFKKTQITQNLMINLIKEDREATKELESALENFKRFELPNPVTPEDIKIIINNQFIN